MKQKAFEKRIGFVLLFFLLFAFNGAMPAFSVPILETSYAGNYLKPEAQSGYSQEGYEVKSGRKLQRGFENFFLCWLEIPQGVKREFAYRRDEYLSPGIETFFIGALRGTGRGFVRGAVGFYEVFTFPYAQEPILEEMSEWAY